MQLGKSKQQKHKPKTPGKTQIPSQICVSPSERQQSKQRTGQESNHKNHVSCALPLRGADQWQRQRGHTGLGEGSQVKVPRFPFLGCCRLPPSLVASLPPVVGPLWRPGPVSVLVPPSGYLVAFATARLLCLNAWCGGALSSSIHLVSWQQRPLALCGVCITLYTMLHMLLRCSVLLRRGIHLLMIQVPIGHR